MLKARELQLGRLFNLSELFKCLWIPGVCRSPLLFKDIERLHEVIISLVSDFLTIVADTELIRPRSDLRCRCFKILDEAPIHLCDLAVDIHDAARFVEVVMVLTEDGACSLFESLVRLGQILSCLELLLH